MEMSTAFLIKPVLYCAQQVCVACDGRCDLAWGRDWQGPRDWPAPDDPGTAEGPDSKPKSPEQRLNRWCARQCERSQLIPFRGWPIEVDLDTWFFSLAPRDELKADCTPAARPERSEDARRQQPIDEGTKG
jgi:hypothetical protein